MQLQNILQPRNVFPRQQCDSKKKLVETLATHIAELSGLEKKHIFDALITRERLGSTGIGEGVAIPHARIAGLQSPVAVLMVLAKSVAFDAIDDQAVDIVLGLCVPEEATEVHLQILADLAELLGSATTRQALRDATSAQAMYTVLTNGCVHSG